jgi:putative ABC transport system substrate-binding protein
MFLSWRRRIAVLAITARLPTIFSFREHVEDGGLMSYGVDLRESLRRGAVFGDKILKGAKPGDLPGRAADKIRIGHQYEDRQGARHHHPALDLGARQ